MVAGDIVNTASRLQSAAAPGTVLVGEATQRAAAGIAFEEAGEQTLKGKALPVPAWRAVRVVSERGGRNRSDALEAPFVGRDEELRLVKELFHATGREQKPRLISVIGPGGIGKSRLAAEFLRYVDGLAATVLWHNGRSPAYGSGISFWALGEMVRERAGLLEGDDEATTREKIVATVARYVPDAEEARWISASLLALLGQQVEADPAQLFAAWRTFFERLAATAPVVMVFEDLHHADTGLLDFIDHFMEWSRGVPITMITLARPDLLERRPEWGLGARTFTSIHLDPLSMDAMRALLSGLVPGLPGPAVERIAARAEGFPLYAIETVRMLIADGQIDASDGVYRPTGELRDLAVPQTLTALIAARLDALEPADRALLEDAAVLGQSFTRDGLAAISGSDPEALEPTLRDFVRRELLSLDADPRSPERGQYSFVQALIREVAYNTLARKDRKARHLAAARYFESLGSGELAGGLASHYLAAFRLAADPAEADALAAQARIALLAAADRAIVLNAHEQAAVFLEEALEVTKDPAEQGRLHARARLEAEEGMDAEAAERHAREAVEAFRAAGDRRATARAIAEYGWTIAGHHDPQRAVPMTLEAWDEFQDLAETPEGVYLMAAVAAAHGARQEYDEAWAIRERFMPLAERFDLVDLICGGLFGYANRLNLSDRRREAMVLLRGALQLATAEGLRPQQAAALIQLTFVAQFDDPAEGVQLAREGLEIGRRTGSRSFGFSMVGNGSICGLRLGEWSWVETLVDEWLSSDRRDGLFMEVFVDRAILRSVQGRDPTSDLDEAERLMPDVSDPQFGQYLHWARAWAAFSAGSYRVAREEASAATQGNEFFLPLVLPLGVRAALWEGDARAASELLGRLDAHPSPWRAIRSERTTLRAGVAALEGRFADSLADYREALRSWRELGTVFDEALAACDMAHLLPASRTVPDLKDAVDEARATLQRLGAAPFLERLEASLVSVPQAHAEPATSAQQVGQTTA
jgi:hypothetical protein